MKNRLYEEIDDLKERLSISELIEAIEIFQNEIERRKEDTKDDLADKVDYISQQLGIDWNKILKD